MILKKVKVDKDIERKITTAFIVSDLFIERIRKAYDPTYMELDYTRRIIKWCLDFFDTYQKAPGLHIQDIYEVEVISIKEAEADIIAHFLVDISEDYENADVMNVEFLVDKALKYFRQRALQVLFEKGHRLTASGKVEDAERLLHDHKTVTKLTSGRFRPFDVDVIRQHLHASDANRLFKFNGALGELVGYFERGWLAVIMAPEKRGKSWLLEELVFAALISRLKVLWVSLEMNRNIIEKRVYQKLTGRDFKRKNPDSNEESYFMFPVFDCAKNQAGTCKKKHRSSMEGIMTDGGLLPSFEDVPDYKPCTWCRNRSRHYKDYVPAYWHKQVKSTKVKTKSIEKKAKNFMKMYKNNLVVKAYPRFGASIDDIIDEINELESAENFSADVVVVDYLDITSPRRGDQGLNIRDRTNNTWMAAARIAGERHCLVVTADQSDAGGRTTRSLSTSNFSEDKRKDAHLDIRIALNQLPMEKKHGVARVSVLFNRHDEYHEEQEVLILQQLGLGQPVLDSHKWNELLDRNRSVTRRREESDEDD